MIHGSMKDFLEKLNASGHPNVKCVKCCEMCEMCEMCEAIIVEGNDLALTYHRDADPTKTVESSGHCQWNRWEGRFVQNVREKYMENTPNPVVYQSIFSKLHH